ncbi:MAG: glycosyltransferase family 2 protein [Bacteroidota bacterium]
MDISIVIPLLNEAESLPELHTWIQKVANQHKLSYEIIFVDDGSTDESWNIIQGLSVKDSNVKGIKFQRNYGKSGALNEGFKAAQGEVVFTMDADLQDSPDELPEMRRMILEEGYDIVSGWKKIRHDNTLTKNIPSKIFNAAARWSSGIHLHDFNCGLKAYNKKVIKNIEVYGEMHRYIPVIAKWAGFKKIGEKPVQHQARKYGVTKFGWERFINGFLDLATISFVSKFGKRPMHFFGLWGSLAFMVGLFSSFYLVVSKFMNPEYAITNRPAFFIALTTMVIGVQLFLAGFLAELIARSSVERNFYHIDQRLGC